MPRDGKAQAKYLKPKQKGWKHKPRPLNAREQLFADAYIGPANLNGKKAAEMVGLYPSYSSKVLRKEHVRQYIVERLEEMKLGKDETHAMLSEIAKVSLADFIDTEEIEETIVDRITGFPVLDKDGKPLIRKRAVFFFNLHRAKLEGKLHLVKSLSETDKGAVKLELLDRKAALDSLARIHGMFTDNLNVKPTATPEDIFGNMENEAGKGA